MSEYKKTYLGDGIYLTNDGHRLILTKAGINFGNQIYLMPHMIELIQNYLDEIKNEIKKGLHND